MRWQWVRVSEDKKRSCAPRASRAAREFFFLFKHQSLRVEYIGRHVGS